ncbi:MAG: tRNA dihydrouridine synthase DusB [Endomicrobiales bacterium]
MHIGSVRLANNLIMAPMAGITDQPFRRLAREGGAGLVCTEMISASALVRRDAKTLKIMSIVADEHPVSVQIFGSEPATMAAAAKIAVDGGADIIDINFGCPVRKIVKAGAGVKLIENESRMNAIMEAVVAAVSVPVTIKIRIGREADENVAPQIVQCAKAAGIALVTVHGRSAVNFHKGLPDLLAVAQAVQAAPIPVIGNGGIVDEKTAKDFLDKTHCAGLMIGRGAIGDPDLFRRVSHYVSTGEILQPPTREKRIDCLKRHARMAADHYGEKRGVVLLRKVMAYYLKGLPNASRIRNEFNKIESLHALDELLEKIDESPYFVTQAGDRDFSE